MDASTRMPKSMAPMEIRLAELAREHHHGEGEEHAQTGW